MDQSRDTAHGSGTVQTSRLRIAQLAPLYERIPPEHYGGTERVVSYITEELMRRGHDVTLFCLGRFTDQSPPGARMRTGASTDRKA